MAAFALTLVFATSLGLLVAGRRYLRRYVRLHGTQPPATWMFRRAADPELETYRRLGLVLLPFYLVAAVIYLAGPGP
jgi:hypothetical protein